MRNKSLLFVMLLGFVTVSAQISDFARVEYKLLPRGSSNFGYSRIRVAANYPIELKNSNYLLVGLDYSNIEMSFDSDIVKFDTNIIQDFQMLEFNLAYIKKLKNDWRLGVRFTPGFSSNLGSKITFEDAVFAGDVVFINDKRDDTTIDKPYRLIVGVSYSQNRGISFPLPFISYYRKFHPKWSYNLGVPKSNLQYHISPKSRLKLVTELDGFTANIQEGLPVNNEEDLAKKINVSLILGGLRYEYKIKKHLEFFCNFSGVLMESAELRNKSNDKVSTVDKKNTIYFGTGIRIKK
ncbi:DUF6268 family outer membrane beta-barrel protein [Cellulophaga sp. 20_2_10]|uniref:DUF6268 family outer membrane beta-barrel protein n=1 Tax=Cellulophaga sp. 20_2_10 TaxID=2942476 RepID=UPI00201AA97D|nr:DUF6268 family outer membrane beta-barrel protein [Cellulophaga sp. 20_2_10]MCL5246214.1 DUF6268 family outer membrane beta-barrel protein [Cellulophaga sp. 20_2_10]